MLKSTKAFSSFSVNDIEKAKDFYGQTLGLEVTEDGMGILKMHINDAEIVVYPKGKDHQAANFTVLNFSVDDVEATVKMLKKRGIMFEHYTGDLLTDENGIFHGGGLLIAWFKDPAGNILSVIESQNHSESS